MKISLFVIQVGKKSTTHQVGFFLRWSEHEGYYGNQNWKIPNTTFLERANFFRSRKEAEEKLDQIKDICDVDGQIIEFQSTIKLDD